MMGRRNFPPSTIPCPLQTALYCGNFANFFNHTFFSLTFHFFYISLSILATLLIVRGFLQECRFLFSLKKKKQQQQQQKNRRNQAIKIHGFSVKPWTGFLLFSFVYRDEVQLLRSQVQESTSLCQAAEVERDRLLELVSLLQKR